MIDRKKKNKLTKELTEGYTVRKSEDRELALEWDMAAGDGIEIAAKVIMGKHKKNEQEA